MVCKNEITSFGNDIIEKESIKKAITLIQCNGFSTDFQSKCAKIKLDLVTRIVDNFEYQRSQFTQTNY